MKFKLLVIIIVNIFCTNVLCWASEKNEAQIGPFNFAGSLLTESKLISSYGTGFIKIDKADGIVISKKHIYYVPDQKVWAEIRLSHETDENLEHFVVEVLVTKNKLCDEKFKPKESFGSLITGEGVQISDSYSKTISTYGTPSKDIVIDRDKSYAVLRDDLKLSKGRVLRYLPKGIDKLLFSEFYFVDGILHSLLISISE